jgi:hypothetical protein
MPVSAATVKGSKKTAVNIPTVETGAGLGNISVLNQRLVLTVGSGAGLGNFSATSG